MASYLHSLLSLGVNANNIPRSRILRRLFQMNVSFASPDPLNSAVIDNATGRLLFVVQTPTPPDNGKRVTTIFNEDRQIVGVFDQHLGRDTVIVRGMTMRVSEWLPKKSWMSSSRLFVAPDGREYLWKHGLGECSQLIETGTQGMAAEADRNAISVGPGLVPFLDMVLLLFLVCNEERNGKNSFTDAVMDFITDVAFCM